MKELFIDQVELDRQFLLEHERDPVWTGERVQRLILSQPAVDAVRAVRCRDCKFHDGDIAGKHWCYKHFRYRPSGDFFCADGTQKE